MTWETFFAVMAGVVGTNIAQWIGRVVKDRSNWTKCPVPTCSFRLRLDNEVLKNEIVADHVNSFHPSFMMLEDR